MSNFLWVENDSGWEYVYWPLCGIEGCANRICYGLSDKYCYPHSPGGSFEGMMDKLKANTVEVVRDESE